MKSINKGVRRFMTPLRYSAIALLLIGAGSTRVQAQEDHARGMGHGTNTIPLGDASALVQIVRQQRSGFRTWLPPRQRDTRFNSAVSAATRPARWVFIM